MISSYMIPINRNFQAFCHKYGPEKSPISSVICSLFVSYTFPSLFPGSSIIASLAVSLVPICYMRIDYETKEKLRTFSVIGGSLFTIGHIALLHFNSNFKNVFSQNAQKTIVAIILNNISFTIVLFTALMHLNKMMLDYSSRPTSDRWQVRHLIGFTIVILTAFCILNKIWHNSIIATSNCFPIL